MADQPDIPPAAAKPKLSRWTIAGLLFLLVPFAVHLSFANGMSMPGDESSEFYRRLYSALQSFFVHWMEYVWLLCGTASVACCLVASRKIKTAGNVWKGEGLAYTVACVAGVIILFSLLCLVNRSWVKGGPGHTCAKSRAMASALMLAIKQYENQYGKMPAPDGLVQDYGRLIFALTDQSPENPHKIPFLVPSKIHAVTGRPELKDPWGNNFVIILNSSGTIQAGTGGIYKTINSNVAVWSTGPNKIDDHGENDGSRWLPMKDDIVSWR